MKNYTGKMAARVLALLFALALAFAQGGALAQSRAAYTFSQQELDRMLAPVALYPDSLLSQVLMASTYPLEVVEAARWSKARPNLSGDEAVRAAEREDWDPSVKSLVAFPQLLSRMDEDLEWTQSLGDAFLDQQAQVMDTVQNLRHRAQVAGNLRSDDRVRVIEDGRTLLLQPVNPQIIYVPYYNPVVVYGSWWWPAPPVYWQRWPGYYARPGFAASIYWGPSIRVSVGFFFGAFDWTERQVRVVHVNNYYYNNVTVNRTVIASRAPGAWHHEPDHRRGVAYRSADAQQRFGAVHAQPGYANRAADERRPEGRADGRADARFDRRPDAHTGAQGRVNAQQAAPAVQAVQADARSENRRSDARSETRPGAEPRVNAVGVGPRAKAPQPAQPAQSAQPAQVVQPAQVDTRNDGRRQRSSEAQARAEGQGNRPEVRQQTSARAEAPRASEPRAEVRPAQPAVQPPVVNPPPHREPGANATARHEPGVNATPRHEPGASTVARPETGATVEARPEAGARAQAQRAGERQRNPSS